MWTVAGSGAPAAQSGVAVHLYQASRSMNGRYFSNADGELMFVPQHGEIRIETELGALDVSPREIAVVPRGMKFRVTLANGAVRGYLCENYGPPFRLPELGPIGSQGLAQRRDFLAPVAAFEERSGRSLLVERRFCSGAIVTEESAQVKFAVKPKSSRLSERWRKPTLPSSSKPKISASSALSNFSEHFYAPTTT